MKRDARLDSPMTVLSSVLIGVVYDQQEPKGIWAFTSARHAIEYWTRTNLP